ncbi:MAG: DUF4339 domain-containing protein [Candidatus Nanopelagicales bacterium]|jgi:hypothetical protein
MHTDPSQHFFSTDRLVEFGLGLAVAKQMVDGMNQAMGAMHVAGADNPMRQQEQRLFYVVLEGQRAGPFSEPEIGRLVSDRRIDKATLVWRPGLTQWMPAMNVPEVLRIVALAPPPVPKPS